MFQSLKPFSHVKMFLNAISVSMYAFVVEMYDTEINKKLSSIGILH